MPGFRDSKGLVPDMIFPIGFMGSREVDCCKKNAKDPVDGMKAISPGTKFRLDFSAPRIKPTWM